MRAICKTIHYSDCDLTVTLTSYGAVYYSIGSSSEFPFSFRVIKIDGRFCVCPKDDCSVIFHEGSKNSCYFFIVASIREALSL